MATTTQNLALIKPAGTDKIRIAQINSNMDTIDAKMGAVGNTPLQTQATNAASSISSLQSGLAIVCNGNTHAAIASGQYAYVRNHSSLTEGLYQATTAIAANATLSTSNLTTVSGGGLNAIKEVLDNYETRGALTSYINDSTAEIISGNVYRNYYVKMQKTAVIVFCIKTKVAISSATQVLTGLLGALGSIREMCGNIGYTNGNVLFRTVVTTGGALQIEPLGTDIPTGAVLFGQIIVGL